MISFVRGFVADSTESSLILEAGGIGYEIFMTGTAIEKAVRESGDTGLYLFSCERGRHAALRIPVPG